MGFNCQQLSASTLEPAPGRLVRWVPIFASFVFTFLGFILASLGLGFKSDLEGFKQKDEWVLAQRPVRLCRQVPRLHLLRGFVAVERDIRVERLAALSPVVVR